MNPTQTHFSLNRAASKKQFPFRSIENGFSLPGLVRRQKSFDTSLTRQVGRVTPCAAQAGTGFPNGAQGMTRPTMWRNLLVTVLVSTRVRLANPTHAKDKFLASII
jgi:hypothetical protein